MRRHDRVLGDLVEQHPVHRHPLGGVICSATCQAIASPSRSGSVARIDGRAVFAAFLSSASVLVLPLIVTYFGLEPVVDVDAELAGGEIAHVTDRRPHVVAAAEVLPDRLGLGGRLDDDERISRAGRGLARGFSALGLARPAGFLAGSSALARLGAGRRASPSRLRRGRHVSSLIAGPHSGGQCQGVQERRPAGLCKERIVSDWFTADAAYLPPAVLPRQRDHFGRHLGGRSLARGYLGVGERRTAPAP